MKVVAAKGEALTVSDVVTEAEVSNGTFYNYFLDKDELLDALATELVLRLGGQLHESMPDQDGALRVATATARILLQARQDPLWAGVVNRLVNLRFDVQDQILQYLRQDLELAQRQGRLQVGATHEAVDLVGGLLAAGLRRVVNGSLESGYEERVLALILRGLGAPAAEIDDLVRQAMALARA